MVVRTSVDPERLKRFKVTDCEPASCRGKAAVLRGVSIAEGLTTRRRPDQEAEPIKDVRREAAGLATDGSSTPSPVLERNKRLEAESRPGQRRA